jgi:enoyl-CoA hydratase/carnithine racemase
VKTVIRSLVEHPNVSTHGPNGAATLDVDDGVAEVRLTAPERNNVFTPGLGEDLTEHLLAVEQNDSVSAMVLTAAGEHFCAGLDVDVVTGDDEAAREALFGTLDDLRRWLSTAPVPVFVGARGAAPGAGAVLIAHTDVRVLGSDAQLWWPEAAFGLKAFEEAVNLVATVGAPKATEVMLLGDEAKLSAEEARQVGLVNRVVDPEAVDDTVRGMAATVAETDRRHGQVGEYLDVLRHARRERDGASRVYARERGGIGGGR